MSIDRFDVGAKWWRDVLVGGAKQDNGDPTLNGVMVKGMMGLLADRLPKLTEAEADKFQSALAEALRSRKHTWGIGVDYHPEAILSDAYKAATGREGGAPPFPIKTHMTFHGAGCQVRYGYGAQPIEL